MSDETVEAGRQLKQALDKAEPLVWAVPVADIDDFELQTMSALAAVMQRHFDEWPVDQVDDVTRPRIARWFMDRYGNPDG
jgi:hypothetical protein